MNNGINLEQKLLNKGRVLALKLLAESFLLGQGNNKTDELFSRNEITVDSTVSEVELNILHKWLIEDYRVMGLDLSKIVEIKGQTFDENKLSDYEMNELIRRADALLVQMKAIKKYSDANRI